MRKRDVLVFFLGLTVGYWLGFFLNRDTRQVKLIPPISWRAPEPVASIEEPK